MSGPPTERPGLELTGVVLNDEPPIDLQVRPGELVAVVGWDSSELLWTVAGLQPPTRGEVRFDGASIGARGSASAAGVALISARSPLASLLTAFENVLLPLAERPSDPGGPELEPAPTARRALEAVGLAESGDHLIEDLSGGQQQRVAVARAIAGRPRLLLADQATTDLDAGNRSRAIELLQELAAAGTAVLLTSDDPAVVDACDRTVVLDPGRPDR